MALLHRIVLQKSRSLSSFNLLHRGNSVLLSRGIFPSLSTPQQLIIRCFSKETLSPQQKFDGTKVDVPFSHHHHVTRKDFPIDFKFGASTSALQTEGTGTEGGRGPSTWDNFVQDPTRPGMESAVDSYNRYKEDVKLIKDIGLDVYRMSISWSRILPKGSLSGGINQEGIDFYHKFFKELIDNGIEPFVTLFHFDLPKALQDDYRGFLDRKIVDDFKDFADICFKEFGEKVKHWTTINEPQIYGKFGYVVNLSPVGDPSTDAFDATHNIILAHAAAAKLYREKYQPTQRGQIGISVVCLWFKPHSDLPQDIEAAERANAFMMGWMMEPLVFGDYPFVMRSLVRDHLPHFTDEEKEMVKGSYDFIGVNYYTSRYAKHIPISPNHSYPDAGSYQHAEEKVEKDGIPIGPLPPGGGHDQIYIYPPGLKEGLIYFKNKYCDPKIFITENGVPEGRDDTIPLEKALQDDHRIESTLGHLHAVREAMKEGVNVNGYFIWALLDCVEWGNPGETYNVRFGLNFTDYNDDLKRYPKKSAKWLTDFLKNRKH